MNVNLCGKKQASPLMNYSPVHEVYGVSPLDYIRRIRLRCSLLLGQQRFTMAEVCYMSALIRHLISPSVSEEFGVMPSISQFDN
jgi:hypothetical protein